ncbi:SDR family NAD(P)-dependent oxidoreductase [Christiangramia sp. OXR-203]|uniref:SDR family NAD(P)-dependent oxidoreductase n=1 Tax=Christiangramia sp. OXR-203 TaxID=3100176 RepID=UPI002AC8C4B4|nr:SDR family NAD(P)-dependent oxidoreductase [Christiangramia sp. OXR-203]WPY97904.1 SDR family NAD(P)-dependent oxidoreductase [Christiangramia sp. OXR-203]
MEKLNFILVTGGAGNIGSALAKALSDKNYKVVVVDNLLTGKRSKIVESEDLIFIKGDVNERIFVEELFNQFEFDYVFHYAAMVGVQRTLSNPLKVLNDIEGIKNILHYSLETGVKRVFYASSSEVYGEPFEIPQKENTTPLNSKLPYAIVKNVGESFFKSYQKEHGLNYTIFRFFNTYGVNQSEDFVIPRFIKAALKDQPIRIYGDGSQTRTFCNVEDNVEVTLRTLEDPNYENQLLNVGSDDEISILELAKKIIKISKSGSRIEFLPPLAEGDMARRCPDISKMKGILNRDLISLDHGIKSLINHYEGRD